MSRRRDSEEMFYELSSRMPGSGGAGGSGRKPAVKADARPAVGRPAPARSAKPSASPKTSSKATAKSSPTTDARHRLDEESRLVEQRIAELKAKALREKRVKEKRDQFKNFIPPPEYRYNAMVAVPQGRRNRREMEEERNTHAVRFLGLFLVVCALLWWLLHSTGT